MASVGPATSVWFQWQADGRCAFVQVINESSYE